MKKGHSRYVAGQMKSKDSDFELVQRLEWIAKTLLKRNVDPIHAVLHSIDPHYDKSARPEVKQNPSIPEDASKGIFRVIYWEKQEKKRKIKSHAVEARDGFDAVNAFTNIDENIFAEARGDIKIIGVECEIIPSNLIKKIQEEYGVYGNSEKATTLGEVAKLNLIEQLENFEHPEEPMTLDKFLQSLE